MWQQGTLPQAQRQIPIEEEFAIWGTGLEVADAELGPGNLLVLVHREALHLGQQRLLGHVSPHAGPSKLLGSAGRSCPKS